MVTWPDAAMQEAAKDLGMSLEALDGYLADAVEGFDGLQKISKFDTGQSNPTYRLDARSGTYVLRSKPPGQLLPSAHAVDREYRVMRALEGRAVPVPKALHLAEATRSPSGRAFFVMEYCDGRIFWDPSLPDQVDRAEIFDAMNQTLAALHGVDVAAAGLSDFGKPGNYFARQIERWTAQYRASVDTPSPEMASLMEWLARQVPPDDGQVSLVHGDWRIDNMIFAPQAPSIVAVLDWELSTLGHPLADLAYQCMQWRLPNHGKMRGLGGIDRAAIGLPSEAEYVATYATRRGVRIDNWPFYLAFAFFRLAAILAGVAARARAGNASNPRLAEEYGKAVPVLAGMAMELIRKP